MPDLTGKIIVVTGGNSGLGYESVKAFAMKGTEVVLASRSSEKGEKAIRKLDAATLQEESGPLTTLHLFKTQHFCNTPPCLCPEHGLPYQGSYPFPI